MKISVIITLKKDVLDPQGKVIHQTLDGMGFEGINEVRQGKYFEIDTKEDDNFIIFDFDAILPHLKKTIRKKLKKKLKKCVRNF